jgi:DNA modification methylase
MDNSTPVIVKINPLKAVPCANIRQIRSRFVAELVANISDSGWRETLPSVYAPIAFEEMIALSQNQSESRAVIDTMQFRIMDGAHRIRALQQLQNDSSVAQFDSNFLIQVKVIPEQVSVIQRSLDAVAENNTSPRAFAKKTFCDDLWTMIGIQSSVVQRVVKFSTALADPAPAVVPDATIRPRRGGGKKPADFRTLPGCPQETAGFLDAYEKYVDRHMVYSNACDLRKPFDPNSADDFGKLIPTVIIALVSDSHVAVGRENPVASNEGVKVKWRILRRFIPYHVESCAVDLEDGFTGGNGIVPVPDRDIRIWDYLCLVNDSLASKSLDMLSYSRIYRPCFMNNAFDRVFCGLLMLTQASYTPQGHRPAGPGADATHATSLFGGRRIVPVPDSKVNEMYATVCAIYRQYNAAASLMPDFSSFEELILPYIILDRSDLLFAVVSPNDEWAGRSELRSFPKEPAQTTTHPVLTKTFVQLDPAQKMHDNECRILAASFLADIERSRTSSVEDNFRDFGSFDVKADKVATLLPPTDITAYVRTKFHVLRAAGFAESFQSIGGGGSVAEEGTDEIEEGPPTRRVRLTQPDADIRSAKKLAVDSLRSVDNVHMFSASFEEFSLLSEAQSLHGTVSLILTDPPYNTRRESGASNSNHDKFSSTDMKQVADLIEKLLRPHGHAFIFCSFQQSMEWRVALESAGGGGCLKVPSVPDVITRDPSAIHSGGMFVYHRVNAYEHAWHVFKERSGATPANYQSTVGFGNANLELCSGMTLPSYCNVMDHYIPPRAPELLMSDGRAVRPEQKSVKLLRDIIRLFAPNPTDIVVDLFAGTMSTVAAAVLEGRPVYACEKDKDCFAIGEARVHDLQYRRAAAGLVRALSSVQVALMRTVVPARSVAPDTLPHEPETYDTEEDNTL